MALICFASQKGAPGVTLTALSAAATWPASDDRRKLFVEADASGGTLALRYGLGLEPGLVTLAVAAQRHAEPDTLWDHAQELPGGLPAIVGPDSPGRAASVLASSAGAIARWLVDQSDLDVIVDLGRLSSDSPAVDLVRLADLTVMVTRPCVEQLQPAAQHMRDLPIQPDHMGWVLVGETPYGSAEVTEAFGYDVVGVMADDSRGAAALEHGATGKRLRRSGLARSAATLAETLAQRVAPTVQSTGIVAIDDGVATAAVDVPPPAPALNGASHGR